MNIKAFFLLLLFSASHLFSQNFAGIYKGTIDKYPITLHLFVNNITNNGKIHHSNWWIKDRLQIGYYYYDRYKKPIALFLSAKNSDNTIELSTASGEKIIVSFKDKFLQGKWVSQGGKALAVNAQLSIKFIDFDHYVKEEIFKFQKPSIAQPVCIGTFSIETVWPNGSSEMDYLRKIFREIIEAQATTLPIEKILAYKANAWGTHFFDESDKEFKEELDYWAQEYIKKGDGVPYLNRCEEKQIYCCYLSSTILSIEKYCHYDAGGAHGSYDSYFTVVNLLNKKKINLEDIFTADGIKELPGLLEKSAKALDHYGCKLYDEPIPVIDNFFINERGISFWYNPYEIAGYARGPIELCLPFGKIKHHLKKDFINLLEA